MYNYKLQALISIENNQQSLLRLSRSVEMSALNNGTVLQMVEAVANATEASFEDPETSGCLITRLVSSLIKVILDQPGELAAAGSQQLQSMIPNEDPSQQQLIQELETNRALLNFNYFISPYAGVCMIMAILLNRTMVFASSRSTNNTRRKTLPHVAKLFLRSGAIFLILKMFREVVFQFTAYSPTLKSVIIEYYKPQVVKKLTNERLLWNVFLTLCCSQFLETFVSIASGQLPSNDTVLTLFEQSLAFQESQFLKTPPLQLLIIISFSLLNQLIIQVMGLTNKKKYQLVPSTIMGISFLIFYSYNIYTGGIFDFPWIVIISIVPQLLVICITTFCLSIYGLAVWINGSSEGLTYTPMMKNLKDTLNLQMNDDFNSVLMRFGFIMFTAVDNEDYVNEYASVNLYKHTYLDDEDSEGTSHLLSGYFNRIEKFPKIMENVKVDKPISNSISITNSWLLFKKYTNLFKLFAGLFYYIVGVVSPRKRKSHKDPAVLERLTLIQERFFRKKSETPEVVDSPGDIWIDDSDDFQYESESDQDPLEYDSDIEVLDPVEYVPTLAAARLQEQTISNASQTSALTVPKQLPINELITPSDLIQLITPTNLDDISSLNNLRVHLLEDRRITRSKFAELNQDDLLREVILQNRKSHGHNDDNDDDLDFEESPCVICQTNQRSIILWPCKCFALCETCRVNLGVRGFRNCVCCRGNVEGFSKVYIP